ncbi:polyunsaturated fatty acid lipoxygenase ALOX15B-like [Sceloporus undulatus]|uniref:polyunsaturated fatty acid lipoxygenase ALOX15B-like n=1 Tax=Sceloporus undulatus TaxID=8520 RepID=UPI001C4A9810|nr:polyunsaturated fatty acid lipoxygenase ALOX15B-like [Sceloporus undulatus]XP_042331737.1 polyunsaturated fatty acid lipoxygenase ALOX15B-like [Sceloporus undulatus]XP_042331738.1 polyunsaturated fatty acid lipoxygenase ALOX15B-like [Sceloporus undulatus]
MRLKAFWGLQERWKILDGSCQVFCLKRTLKTAYSAECWKKGAFFGSRYSNQINPALTHKCSKTSFTRSQGTSLGTSVPLQEELQPPKNREGESQKSYLAGSKHGEIPAGPYRVRVATGTFWGSGTFDAISITLVGSSGESPKQRLNNMGKDFIPGAVDEYEVHSEQDLGPVLLVRLHKDPYLFFPEDSWYCNFVQLTTPQGETYYFPCYQWIEGYRTLELREGTGKLVCDDVGTPLLLQHRAEELKTRQDSYRWGEFAPGMPRCLAVESLEEMDTNIKFCLTKLSGFMLRSKITTMELKWKGFLTCSESWKKLEDIRKVFWFNKTPVSEYVADHWQEDAFFGYQYLNGVNPVVIEKCTEIPSNFPITHEMVARSLGESTTLQEEVQMGNVFIVDYKILQDIPTNTIEGQPQYMTVPLCLLYQTPAKDLIPIAIQLSQTPSPDSPIFLPSDPFWDWTLAKMWVRNADFHIHQNLSHLLRTHLLAEIFSMATLRQLPMCHPLFKLLIPHLRYTFQINTLARVRLIREGGMMDQATSAGYEGIVPLVGKGASSMTYSSLCLPEDIEARGVTTVANYYYRDDGMKIWAAIESFVGDMVKFYYRSDDRIQSDPELQAWVQEIFREAFQSRENSGAPSSLGTMEELTKFLTMVIFTCSAQHAAVNSGQFDFGAWIPNIPPTMRRPPPTRKGTATLESILETLPQVNITCIALSSLWLLSNDVGDRRPLGHFPDKHFSEDEPKRLIGVFQSRLAQISEEIQERNKSLALPYEYISPPMIENSVAI